MHLCCIFVVLFSSIHPLASHAPAIKTVQRLRLLIVFDGPLCSMIFNLTVLHFCCFAFINTLDMVMPSFTIIFHQYLYHLILFIFGSFWQLLVAPGCLPGNCERWCWLPLSVMIAIIVKVLFILFV